MITIQFFMSGLVQGVCFRKSTLDFVQSKKLKLTGYVRNLEDGRVEVMTTGDINEINQLEEFLNQGSELSRVDRVTKKELGLTEFDEFTIQRL